MEEPSVKAPSALVKTLTVLSLTMLASGGGLLLVTRFYAMSIAIFSIAIICIAILAARHAHKRLILDQMPELITANTITQEVVIEHESAMRPGYPFRYIKPKTSRAPQPFRFTFSSYFATKDNRNMAVVGGPGAGKTTLVEHCLLLTPGMSKLVNSLKPEDRAMNTRLHYRYVSMAEHLPNPMLDPHAMVAAFQTAVAIDQIGMAAGYIPDVILEICKENRSKSWPEFMTIGRLKLKKEGDPAKRMAIVKVLSVCLASLYDENAEYSDLPKEEDVFLDWSTIKDPRKLLFYLEYLLREINTAVTVLKTRHRVLLITIEGYRILHLKDHHGNSRSILEDVLRGWRSTNSACWVDTQSLTDLSKTALDACDTQPIFKTGNADTLRALREVTPLLPEAVTNLRDHAWCDAKQTIENAQITKAVYSFRLHIPKEEINASTVALPGPDWDKPDKELTVDEILQGNHGEIVNHERINYYEEVVTMLSQGPMFPQEIAERIVAKHYPDLPAELRKYRINEAKFNVKDVLKRLMDEVTAKAIKVQLEHKKKPYALYYLVSKR